MYRTRQGSRRNERGQGTVEAAFAIPLLFTLMLLLIQPGLILYDRAVMGNAAAEGCRVLVTGSPSAASACESFVKPRLASIPPLDNFHVREGEGGWDIELDGDENSEVVSVTIRNQVRPLPLVSLGSDVLGLTNGQGNFKIEATCSMPTQPAWVRDKGDAGSWAGAWMS